MIHSIILNMNELNISSWIKFFIIVYDEFSFGINFLEQCITWFFNIKMNHVLAFKFTHKFNFIL